MMQFNSLEEIRKALLSDSGPCRKVVCMETMKEIARLKQDIERAYKIAAKKDSELSAWKQSEYELRNQFLEMSRLLIEKAPEEKLLAILLDEIDLIKAEEERDIREIPDIVNGLKQFSYRDVFPEGHRAFAARMLQEGTSTSKYPGESSHVANGRPGNTIKGRPPYNDDDGVIELSDDDDDVK